MSNLMDTFIAKYGQSDNICVIKSPLRICPIGAHSDYQGGRVTGMTLDASVDMVYAPREDNYVEIQSEYFLDTELFSFGHDLEYIPGFWGSYIRGAVKALQEDHVLKVGLNAVVSGKLPIGGLSSSAAVTTAYLMALCDVNNIEVSKMDIIMYSHWVETKFIGLKNGILDQSANVLSMNNQLMLMDRLTNEYEMIDKGADFKDFEVIVVYSGISKNLMGTDFNNRDEEVRVAGWLLLELAGQPLPALEDVKLRNIPIEIYNKYKDQLPDRFRKRAAHIYTEQERVLRGAEAYAKGDIENFGQLMFESGNSSFYQQETGIPEMKLIFDILQETDGVYGARSSGAGFRGAVIGLINPSKKDEIKVKIDCIYPEKSPAIKDVYEVNFCKTDDGARFVNVEDYR